MKLFGFEVNEPKFSYEDEVWVYFDPAGLVEPSALPIFKCEIQDLCLTANSDCGRQTEVEYAYTVMHIDSFDEPSYKDECDIFSTEDEAKAYALSKLKNRAETIKKKSDDYQKIIRQLDQTGKHEK